ncbi:unnamed protein product, partial [Rotaria sp. Silwood1]
MQIISTQAAYQLNHACLQNFDDDFRFLDGSERVPMVVASQGTTVRSFLVNNTGKSTEPNSSVDTDAIQTSVDTRQTNREKVIAELYWQRIFDEEKQNKT